MRKSLTPLFALALLALPSCDLFGGLPTHGDKEVGREELSLALEECFGTYFEPGAAFRHEYSYLYETWMDMPSLGEGQALKMSRTHELDKEELKVVGVAPGKEGVLSRGSGVARQASLTETEPLEDGAPAATRTEKAVEAEIHHLEGTTYQKEEYQALSGASSESESSKGSEEQTYENFMSLQYDAGSLLGLVESSARSYEDVAYELAEKEETYVVRAEEPADLSSAFDEIVNDLASIGLSAEFTREPEWTRFESRVSFRTDGTLEHVLAFELEASLLLAVPLVGEMEMSVEAKSEMRMSMTPVAESSVGEVDPDDFRDYPAR